MIEPKGVSERAQRGLPSKKRVLVAGIFHQTNTFVRGRTSLEDFEILRGEEMLRAGSYASPLAGLVDAAREKGWELLPVVDMHAVPGATVADAVVDLFWAEFRAVADAEADAGIDGVFLVLHGAMVSESLEDVEGELLRRIRGVEHLSDAPVCGVMDPRVNFTETMRRQSDGLVAHRENPPTDASEASTDVALLLDGLMETEDRPATVWDRPPIMLPPSVTTTDSGPIRLLEQRAREIETELPNVVAVNVCVGFPYADVPEAGIGFSAVTNGDLELARASLRELNVMASSLREAGGPTGMPLAEAMSRLEDHYEGPVLLVEPSDSVESGAPGDATRVLRALVEHGVPEAGVVISDAEAVRYLWDVPLGQRRELEIGGKSAGIGAEPLSLDVEVVSRTDGRFVPEDDPESPLALMLDGEVDMGPCALVRHGSVLVLLTSRRTPPLDLGQWRSQGVDPEEFFTIGVKAATEHRSAYGAIARASYTVDLPGPCAEDLRRLPFEHVSRPIYPLDEL